MIISTQGRNLGIIIDHSMIKSAQCLEIATDSSVRKQQIKWKEVLEKCREQSRQHHYGIVQISGLSSSLRTGTLLGF